MVQQAGQRKSAENYTLAAAAAAAASSAACNKKSERVKRFANRTNTNET
jgi:hypothetical protein